jgi:hypothetical protein
VCPIWLEKSQIGRAIRYIFLLQKSNKKDTASITHTKPENLSLSCERFSSFYIAAIYTEKTMQQKMSSSISGGEK